MSVPLAALALLIAAAPISAADLPEPDLFIGTLALERGEVILTHCDLAAKRYVLRDAARSHAVARYRHDRMDRRHFDPEGKNGAAGED